MAVDGVEVQPAKKGVNPNKGHHHLLIDVDLPKDLNQRIGKTPTTFTWVMAPPVRN